jgi:hypothetical protein
VLLPEEDRSAQGTMLAEYIWGAPAPNSLLAQRPDGDYPRVYDPNQALHLD